MILEKCKILAADNLPGILSQINRGENVPDYGGCGRKHHHYKIHDFSSIIIQQAGYAAWCASLLPENAHLADELCRTARSSCLYWNKRAVKFRSFEEYYPREEGDPPVAFSTLAAGKPVSAGVVEKAELYAGMQIAAKHLQ